jgi:hypothetical protein
MSPNKVSDIDSMPRKMPWHVEHSVRSSWREGVYRVDGSSAIVSHFPFLQSGEYKLFDPRRVHSQAFQARCRLSILHCVSHLAHAEVANFHFQRLRPPRRSSVQGRQRNSNAPPKSTSLLASHYTIQISCPFLFCLYQSTVTRPTQPQDGYPPAPSVRHSSRPDHEHYKLARKLLLQVLYVPPA